MWHLIPAPTALYPDVDKPYLRRNEFFFPQDGAPIHYPASVRAYLDVIFLKRWRGLFE